jgi:hypothetical protein
VKPYLILSDSDEATSVGDPQQAPGGLSSEKITKSQLLELQRKMLNHLMELYGD